MLLQFVLYYCCPGACQVWSGRLRIAFVQRVKVKGLVQHGFLLGLVACRIDPG